MGGAFAATADDPSAIFYNVAGIAQLRRTEITFGGTAINFQNSFTGDPNDLFTAGMTGSKNRAHTFIVPNAYATMPIGSNMTVGVGVFAPFAKRGNLYRKHVKPVKQVLAKFIFANHCAKIPVCRGDNSRIDMDRFGTS